MLSELFSYAFIVRALIVGTLVALCAALLGVSLVLKRYSMIGDGLSHVGFGALSVALALNVAPLEVSLPVVAIAAFLLLRLSERSVVKGDAAIALVSSSAIAIGIIVVSMTTGMNVDVYNYMFGSILAMSDSDVYLSVGVSVVVLALYIVFYNRIFAVTFDESFAKATGIRAGRYNMLIALLTALVIVVGMRMMGAMLISSLIIFPALTAMRVLRSFKSVVVCAAVLSVVCFVIGIAISFAWSVPVGAGIVVSLGAVLGVSAVGPTLGNQPSQWVNAGPEKDFPVGGITSVTLHYKRSQAFHSEEKEVPVLVRRDSEQDFICFSSSCPHLGCAVSWDELSRRFKCACHGGAFDRDGKVIAGPPPSPLPRLPWKLENGILKVEVV